MDVRKGWLNCDKYPLDNRIRFVNLEDLPLPFEDDSMDEIRLCNVLEHLWVNPYSFMLDIHRILVPDGMVYIELPLLAFQVEHIRGFHRKHYFNTLIYKPGIKPAHSQNKGVFKLVSFNHKFLWGKIFPFIRVHNCWVLKKRIIGYNRKKN